MKAESHNDAQEPERTSLPEDGEEKPQAWELIDVGRVPSTPHSRQLSRPGAGLNVCRAARSGRE